MRYLGLKYTVLSWVTTLSIIIFLLVPFQGFLTVWGSSLVGHYTALRLWDELLLIVSVLGVVFLFFTDKKIRISTLYRRLVWLILAYIALTIALGVVAYLKHNVTKKALGYGLIVNLRFLLFFLVTWSAALRLTRLKRNWQRLVIWPSVIVILFALAQIFLLPHDFLKHFGYGPSTIPVTETINNNSHYLRFASTLRGANPLGTYLIIPISLLAVMLLTIKRRLRYAWLLTGALIVMFYTFSRSSWAGVLIALVTLFIASRLSVKTQKYALYLITGLIFLGAVLTIAFHNSAKFQNFVFHTQTHSAVKSTSDENHLTYLKAGVKDVVKHPLGDGPGTAGPASVYNDGKTRLAENYLIQIGQEAGWLGLILFVLINIGVGYLLWLRRDDPLALTLFASLIGISFVCLLSHAWTDDTLAFIWWGLAGIAMAPNNKLKNHQTAR